MKKIFTTFHQSKILLLALAFSLSILAGCKKEMADEVLVTNTSQPSYLSQYNILTFKNMNDLQQMIADNAATAGNTVKAMNASFPNFISMKNIYTQFDKKEATLLENLPDSVFASTHVDWTRFLKMSDIGRTYSNMILVKQFADNLDYYYEMNIREKFYADFVNPEGLIVVNDTIFEFTANRVKLITDGDYAKIRLLSAIDTTSPPDHVIVISSAKFVPGHYQPSTGTAGCKLTWDKLRETTAGSGITERRVGLNVHFDQHPEYGSLIKTSCYAALEYAKIRPLIFSSAITPHIWVDAYPTACYLDGQFSASHAPRSIVPGVSSPPVLGADGSGYTAAIPGAKNPFTGARCYMYSPFYHYTDYSQGYEPCYAMTHGNYQMLVNFTGSSATVNVIW